MMQKIATILIIFLIGTTGGFAQKYSSTTNETIITTYEEISFNSENTLYDNLTQSDEFSVFSGMVKDYGTAIFKDDFMGTVFVMVDDAFEIDMDEDGETDILPSEVEAKILKYHIVPGRLDAHGIKKAIEKSGGTAYFATLNGEKLGVRMSGDRILLFDAQNNTSEIIAFDLYHKHGFFHITTGLLMPGIE